MARLNIVNPSESTGRVKEIFDGPLKGMEINIFKGLANSPVGLEAYLGLAGAQKAGKLSGPELEAVALTIGEANNCEYCVAAHTVLGQKAGLTEDQTVTIRKGDPTGDARIDAISAFARSINDNRGFVSDEDIQSFRNAGFGDDAIVEVLVTVALNTFTNYFNHINKTEVDFPAVPALA